MDNVILSKVTAVRIQKMPKKEMLEIRRTRIAKQDAIKWFYKNYKKFKKEYPKEWILTDGKKVVSHSPDFDKLLEMKRNSPDRFSLALEFVHIKNISVPSSVVKIKIIKR